jgi:hypothetical protein
VRLIRIVGLMVLYGAIWGAVFGAIVGTIVGIIGFVISIIAYLPKGAFDGLQIGVILGFICGLVSIPFALRSEEVSRLYSACVRTVCLLVAPVLVFLKARDYFSPDITTDLAFLQITIMVSVPLSLFLSYKLIRTYHKLIS